MGIPVTVIDAFTDTAFRGNPAAVCVLPEPAREAWMAAVAAELNLPMTAFASPRPDSGDSGGGGDAGDGIPHHDLRWFTPTVEVPLCGHATLATIHLLGGRARFHTRRGVLTGHRADEGHLELDLPALVPEPVRDPPDVTPALGLPRDRMVGMWRHGEWMMAELPTPDDVRAARPDGEALVAAGCGTLIVVATTGAGVGNANPADDLAPAGDPGSTDPAPDTVCRVFEPASGLEEDPVTGSAHCLIAPWLAARTGRDRFTGHQASARGGTVGMRTATGAGGEDRVVLSGHAVTVLSGELDV